MALKGTNPSRPFRESQGTSWDREYTNKGALWRGPAHFDFDIAPGACILELGCGNGKTLSALLKLNAAITAIDVSPRAVEMCRELVRERGDVRVLVADVCALPFPDSSFDVVVCFHVLEHLLEGDRNKAVSEIARVLAPGGRALVQAFSTGDMRFGKGKEVEPNTFVRGTKLAYHYFTPAELRALFARFRERSCKAVSREVIYHKERYAREKLLAEYAKE